MIRSSEKMLGISRINYEPVNRYAGDTLPGRCPSWRRSTQIVRDPDLLPGSREEVSVERDISGVRIYGIQHDSADVVLRKRTAVDLGKSG